MSFAGVNLRVEDIDNYRAACATAGIDPTTIPVLAILHDDTDALLRMSYQAFAELNVRVWRCMAFNSQLPIRAPDQGGLPAAAHIIGWNEADDDSAYPNLPGWVDSWWQQVRQQRPDLTISYGAPNVDGYLLENTALEAALDVVDRHIGATFAPPPTTIQGKPVWVTEIDVDPNTDTYDQIVPCAAACVKAGIPAFVWGWFPDAPNASSDPEVLKGLIAINQGGTMADTLDQRVAALEQRDALLTQAIKRMLEGQYTGAGGAAADVVALQGGTDDISGKVKVPVFQ